MYCSQCGAKIPDGGIFCESCGFKTADMPPAAVAEENPVTPAAPAYEAPAASAEPAYEATEPAHEAPAEPVAEAPEAPAEPAFEAPAAPAAPQPQYSAEQPVIERRDQMRPQTEPPRKKVNVLAIVLPIAIVATIGFIVGMYFLFFHEPKAEAPEVRPVPDVDYIVEGPAEAEPEEGVSSEVEGAIYEWMDRYSSVIPAVLRADVDYYNVPELGYILHEECYDRTLGRLYGLCDRNGAPQPEQYAISVSEIKPLGDGKYEVYTHELMDCPDGGVAVDYEYLTIEFDGYYILEWENGDMIAEYANYDTIYTTMATYMGDAGEEPAGAREYLLPDSADVVYTPKMIEERFYELCDMGLWENTTQDFKTFLRYARNEVFANYGNIFESPELNEYFYEINAELYPEPYKEWNDQELFDYYFTNAEKANIETIHSMEQSLG